MGTSIEAATLTALKTSLGTAGHGWIVLGVDQEEQTVTVESGGLLANVIKEALIVRLKPAALKNAGGTTGVVTYRSIVLDGTLAYQTAALGSATFTVVDSALDTAVRAKATAFLSAQDAAFKAMLDAGAVATIPSDLLAALIASLGDTDHGWVVQSRMLQPAEFGATVTVSLATLDVKVPPALGMLPVPMQLAYIADLTHAGVLLSARVILSATEWVSTSSSLHTAILTLVAAHVGDRADAITTALETGPA